MRVIVHAEDLGPRRDDGYYTKHDIGAALDIFFGAEGDANSLDHDGGAPLSREDAEALFRIDSCLTFYNAEGEKIVITLDPSV